MKKGKKWSFWTKETCFLAKFSLAELGGTPSPPYRKIMNCAIHPKILFRKGFRYAYDVIICVCLTFEKVPCSQYRCKPTEDLVCMFNIQPTAVLNKSLHEPPKSCLHYLSTSIDDNIIQSSASLSAACIISPVRYLSQL